MTDPFTPDQLPHHAGDRAVVLLPGMTLNATIFPPLARRGALEIEFTDLVLSPTGDLPDHPDGPMGCYLDLLDARLEEWEAWARAERRVLVGHSFGGMLALAWLARGRVTGVTGLVLIGTTAGPMYDAASLRLAGFGHHDLRLPLGPFVNLWNRPWITRGTKRLLTRGRLGADRQDFQTLTHPTDGAVDRLGWKNTDWRAMRSFRQAMVGFDVRDRLSRIDVPAVVLHGDRDSLIAPGYGRELAESLPDGRFRLVPGAAHVLTLTHGEAVQRAIQEVSAPG